MKIITACFPPFIKLLKSELQRRVSDWSRNLLQKVKNRSSLLEWHPVGWCRDTDSQRSLPRPLSASVYCVILSR